MANSGGLQSVQQIESTSSMAGPTRSAPIQEIPGEVLNEVCTRMAGKRALGGDSDHMAFNIGFNQYQVDAVGTGKEAVATLIKTWGSKARADGSRPAIADLIKVFKDIGRSDVAEYLEEEIPPSTC